MAQSTRLLKESEYLSFLVQACPSAAFQNPTVDRRTGSGNHRHGRRRSDISYKKLLSLSSRPQKEGNWRTTQSAEQFVLIQALFAAQHLFRASLQVPTQSLDLLLRDNRASTHLAMGCSSQLRRKLYRTTVEGDAPF